MKISNITILSTDLTNNTAKISFTISEATENVNVYLKINDEEYVEIFLNKTNEVLEYTVNVSRGVNNLFLKATDSTTEYISEPIQVLLKETPSIENLECSYSDSTGKYILNFAFNGDINFKYNIYLKLDTNDYMEVLSSQISGDKTIEQTSTMGNHTCILKVSDGYDDYTFSPFQFEITNHKPILSKVLVTDITNSGEAYIYYSTKDIEPSTLTHKLIIGTTETVITPTKVDNFYSYRITGLSEGTSNCKISISDGIDTISSDVFSIEVFSDTTNKKELLRRAKVRYDSAYQQLRDIIVSVTSDLKYDYDIENALIAKAQDNYKIEYSNFNKISQQSIDAIGNNKVTVTKKELQSEIKDVDNAVNSLENTMWGVFQDGVLDQTERDTLSSSLDLVTKEKSDIDKGYQTLYNNEDLIDPSKTKLQTNYNNFIKAHNSLVTTINNIINKEGIINNTDKTNIDTAFENWRTALGNYRVASLEAIDSIAKKKADNSADVVDKKWAEIVLDPETGIKTQVGSLQTKITGADGIEERLETTNSKVSSIETNLNGITQRVSSTETTTATLTNKVNTVEDTANSAQSTANSANSSATNALNKANDANTLANSKAKVFTSTPTVPYQVGDLWVQGTNGDVMKCKTARTSGSYTASDWEKASKYTDDTKANAVDGKITNLQTEYNKTKSQVAEIVTDLNGITQRVSSTESTTATLTTKVTDAQNTANSAQSTANSANSSATNALNTANNTNSKVDNMQIGGRNLLLNSGNFKNTSHWSLNGGSNLRVETKDGFSCLSATGSVKHSVIKLEPSTTYMYWTEIMFNADMGVTNSVPLHYWVNSMPSGTSRGTVTVVSGSGTAKANKWHKIVLKIDTGTLVSGDTHIELTPFIYRGSMTESWWLKYIQVEKGTKPSDWKPAPEDVDSSIDAVDGKVTTLQGEYNTTKSKVATLETNLNGITQRVSSTESTTATLTTKVNNVESTANTAKSTADTANNNATNALNTANSTNTKLNNLQIGGRNLLRNSQNYSNWLGEHGTTVSTIDNSNEPTKILQVTTNAGAGASGHVKINVSNYIRGKEYILSFYAKNISGDKTIKFEPHGGPVYSVTSTSEWVQYKVKIIPNQNWSSTAPYFYFNNKNNTSVFQIKNVKLEEGNKATDWTPAPEDIDGVINSVDSKVNTLQGEYNTTKSKVATLETNLDGITQRVSTTESTTVTLTNKVDNAQNTANSAKSTADSAKTTATNALNTANSTNTKLNNLQIGGRNLIRKADVAQNNSTATFNESTKTWTIKASAGAGGTWGCGLVLINKNILVPYGKSYVLSFEIKVPRNCSWNADVNNYALTGSSWAGNDNDNISKRSTSSNSLTANQWTKCWVKWENTNANNSNKVDLYDNSNFGVVMQNETSNMTYEIRNIQGELGNMPTEYTPALEDVDSAINSVDSKVNTLRTEYNSTKSKVATIETDLSGITSRVSSAETNIEKISNASSQNLLYNSDFRIMKGSLPDGWTVDDNSKITLDTSSTLLDGIPTFWFNVTGLTEYAWKAVYSPFIDAKAGEKFVASAYVKGHNNWSVLDAGGGLEIEYFNDSTRLATSGASINNSNPNWQRLVAKGIAPTGTTKVRIRVHPVKNGQFNMSKPMLQYGETVTGWDRGFDIKNLTTRLKTAEQKITDNAITNTVKKNFYTKSETDNQITSKGYQTQSQVQQTVNGLEVKVSQSGGYNLLYNGNFERGLEHWSSNGIAQDKVHVERNNNGCPVNPIELKLEGTLGSGSGYVSQSFSWSSNESLTLSWYQWTSLGGADGSNVYRGIQVTITYTDGSNSWHTSGGQTDLNVWQKRTMVITPTSGKRISWISVEMWARDTSKQIVYTSLMLEKGTIATNWTPNPNEMHDGIITLDKDGVKVEMQDGEGSQGYSLMSYDGFSIFDSNNNRTAWFGQDDTSYINTLYTNNVECNRLVKLQPGRPQQFYVNANPPSGSDGSGTSVSNACRSITEMFRKIKSTYGQYSNWQDITINVAEGSYYETIEILGFMGCGKIYVKINANAKLYGFWKIYDNTMKVVIDGERTGGNNANNGAQFFLTDESITTLIHVRNSVCMVKNVRSINKCRPNSSGDKYGCSFIHVEAGRAMMINCDVSRYLYAMQATECSIGNVAGSRGYAYTSCFAKYGSHIITSGYPNEVKASWSSWGGHVEINGSKYASLYDSNYESSSSTTPSKPSTSATVFSQSFTLENLKSIPEGSGSPTSKRSGVIGQGKWGRYKPHRGWGNIPSSLVDFCKNSTNISMTITMTRQNTNHGYAGAVPSPKFIYSGGTWDSGTTFARGATKTITLPSTIVNAIANGSMTSIQLYAGYSTNDYSFYQNITITVRLTKNI